MNQERQAPGEFMASLFGRRVLIKLTSNEIVEGKLTALDGNMNIVLEMAETRGTKNPKKYDSIFLRGNNGKQNELNT